MGQTRQLSPPEGVTLQQRRDRHPRYSTQVLRPSLNQLCYYYQFYDYAVRCLNILVAGKEEYFIVYFLKM